MAYEPGYEPQPIDLTRLSKEARVFLARQEESFGHSRGGDVTVNITDAEALRLGKVAWVAYQEDKAWAESVVEDVFSPADDLPEEALDMIAVARAVLEAAGEVRS